MKIVVLEQQEREEETGRRMKIVVQEQQEREEETGQQNENCCIGTAGERRRNRTAE